MTEPNKLSPPQVKRIMLARLLLNEALDQERSGQELRLFAAMNQLQDAVEVFLLAVAEEVDATLDQRTDFNLYLDRIDAKIAPAKLPFRPKLIRLNKIRVGSKHALIQPQTADVRDMLIVVREFFAEVAQEHLGVDFATIHLVDLIRNDEVRTHLQAAVDAYASGKYAEALIESRKAFFIRWERDADIARFAERPSSGYWGLLGPGGRSPEFAKNPTYIAQSVKDPFGYIVFDHAALTNELVASGVDTLAFWNIWRLTPKVYRTNERGWLVRHELAIVTSPDIILNAAYVIDNLISIVLHLEERDSKTRTSRWDLQWQVYKPPRLVPIYSSADRSGPPAAFAPVEWSVIQVTAATVGLRDNETYWCVSDGRGPTYLTGYVSEHDVSLTPLSASSGSA